jgi:hypothetical protein
MALGKITVVKDYQVGLVKAPNCAECGAKMKAFNEHCWTCTDKSCRCYGIGKIVPGVYPLTPVSPEALEQVAKKRGEHG